MSRLVIIASTACLIGVAILATGITASETDKKETASSAVIVIQGLHSRKGVGEFKALSVLNKEDVAKLEAFFPKYQTQPASNAAAGWEAGYKVYFNFRNGRSLRVTVSENANGKFWTMGNGDFLTRGDFPAFAKELIEKTK